MIRLPQNTISNQEKPYEKMISELNKIRIKDTCLKDNFKIYYDTGVDSLVQDFNQLKQSLINYFTTNNDYIETIK